MECAGHITRESSGHTGLSARSCVHAVSVCFTRQGALAYVLVELDKRRASASRSWPQPSELFWDMTQAAKRAMQKAYKSIPDLPDLAAMPPIPSMPAMASMTMPTMPSMPSMTMPTMPSMPSMAMPSMPSMPKLSMPTLPSLHFTRRRRRNSEADLTDNDGSGGDSASRGRTRTRPTGTSGDQGGSSSGPRTPRHRRRRSYSADGTPPPSVPSPRLGLARRRSRTGGTLERVLSGVALDELAGGGGGVSSAVALPRDEASTTASDYANSPSKSTVFRFGMGVTSRSVATSGGESAGGARPLLPRPQLIAPRLMNTLTRVCARRLPQRARPPQDVRSCVTLALTAVVLVRGRARSVSWLGIDQ